jgi:hypothetical protein
MDDFKPTAFSTALLALAALVALSGCASSEPPALQWWRVGECLVVYDDRDANRHMVVAGNHQCDIKRQDLTNAHGTTRATTR